MAKRTVTTKTSSSKKTTRRKNPTKRPRKQTSAATATRDPRIPAAGGDRDGPSPPGWDRAG